MAAKAKPKSKDKALTVERAIADFKLAYEAKHKLIERQREDFLFALGEQWSEKDKSDLDKAGIKPVTDNRIQPNIFLLTGLERQNRTDFKAFPEGDEDGLEADIATALLKDVIKKSDFGFVSSDQFKDGITCGESHLELYLDYADSFINGKPCWRKFDSEAIFPAPSSRKYDFADAPYVYKVTVDIAREDLKNLYPEKEKEIDALEGGRMDIKSMLGASGSHRQFKDYPQSTNADATETDREKDTVDLIERYYKKWKEKFLVCDQQTGKIVEAEDESKAKEFIANYQAGIQQNLQAYQAAVTQVVTQAHASMGVPAPAAPPATPAPADPLAAEPSAEQVAQSPLDENPLEPQEATQAAPVAPQLPPLTPDLHEAIRGQLEASNQLPPPPPAQDPERFLIVKRQIPEIWCFAFVPGMEEPLADQVAGFYPKWKSYPFVPYFARFSTAPIRGEYRHLLVQGIVHAVKGVQEKHNKAEVLLLRHLNTSANSGWLAEENAWVDPQMVKLFGSAPGVNLEYKAGKKPERITPSPLSPGHAEIAASSAEAIKAQLGINADLLATQQGGTDSGRAIALRQRQGLLMVQELFDNLSRSRQIAGKFLLSQLGEIYDTETAMKVLGEAFLAKNFPPLMLADPANPTAPPQPENGDQYDKKMAEQVIGEVLAGDLWEYNVSVGESVSSETQKMANSAEIKEIAQTYPGIVPPDILLQYSQLPESAKHDILAAMERAQQEKAQMLAAGGPGIARQEQPQ